MIFKVIIKSGNILGEKRTMFLHLIRLLTFLIITVFPAKTQYNVDIIDVEWTDKTESKFEQEWEISRPSRGVYALSGIMNIKDDINTNNNWAFVDIYYSANGISYMLSPYRIPRIPLTDCINITYKYYLMETAKECCENPIDFEEKFKSPLTKRRMVCENCLFPTDNLPTHLRKGYYRIEIVVKGEIESEAKFLIYIVEDE